MKGHGTYYFWGNHKVERIRRGFCDRLVEKSPCCMDNAEYWRERKGVEG